METEFCNAVAAMLSSILLYAFPYMSGRGSSQIVQVRNQVLPCCSSFVRSDFLKIMKYVEKIIFQALQGEMLSCKVDGAISLGTIL